MASIEWVHHLEAGVRLAVLWDILIADANDIVRNVVHGGRVEVRATRRYHTSSVYEIVTGKIQLSQAGLWARDYETIEIDWNGLLEEGSKLLPSRHVMPSKRTRSTPDKPASSKKQVQKPGPRRGSINRFNDETLFPELDRLIRDERMTATAAALKLAREGKVKGIGSSSEESRARRLRKKYQERNSLPLAPTRSN